MNQSNLRHRVAITGIGLITPLGNDTKTTWNNIIVGRSGTHALPDSYKLHDYPAKSVALVHAEQERLNAVLPAKNHSRADRFIHLALIAGDEAMSDAGFSLMNPLQRNRFGVYLGVGVGGLGAIGDAVIDFERSGPKKVSPFTIPKIVSNLAPAWLTMQHHLYGPHAAITNACASGTDAIGLAFRMIRDGYVDYMLAGGAESCVTPTAIAGFGNMRALSTWSGDPACASRPFDRQRTGFVMAEGAGLVVLERLDYAVARGARIYAEVSGYGACSDAFHITAMHPGARGATEAMRLALDDAGTQPDDVGYVNAHGTGTPMNDVLETVAIKKVFGSHADPSVAGHLMVSSTKSMTGHMLGAAGGAEAAFAALALQHQIVPPTINLSEPDEACDLDYVAHTARQHSMRYALSNSFGFGGANSVLLFKAWKP